MAWIWTDVTGRVEGVTENREWAAPDAFEFDLPDDFDMGRIYDYAIIDGQVVESVKPPSEEETAAQEERQRQEQIQAASLMMARMMAPQMTDTQALSVPLIFNEWEDLIGQELKAETVVRHEGGLYRVAQNHTAQEQYPPGDGTESLYTHIKIDEETGYDVWQPPTGAHDAYNTGDRVLYPDENGQVYESKIDGNTWSPEEYPAGWKKI